MPLTQEYAKGHSRELHSGGRVGKLTPHTRLHIIALKLTGSSHMGPLHVSPIRLCLTLPNRELHSIPDTQERSPWMSSQRQCYWLRWDFAT